MKSNSSPWRTSGISFICLLVALMLPVQPSAEVSVDTNADFTSIPINLSGNDVTPLVMMNISRDHQLSYKAYNDFSDLNNDQVPETTYVDSIDYYGYFDTKKCYTYNNAVNRFEPTADATGANFHYCTGAWSGNFMNWATMTRMDIVRKLLYGGMRSTDTASLTVLERHYLPTDAHAFAKHYNGPDIAQLTPFTTINTLPPSGTSVTPITIGAAPVGTPHVFTTSLAAVTRIGDQVRVYINGQESTKWMIGGVIARDATKISVYVPPGSYAGGGTSSTNWVLENLSQTGITLCNLTTGSTTGDNRYSDTNTNPPLIRVVKGNFALWTANERWQGYWSEQKSNQQGTFTDPFRSNGNRAYFSGLNASGENPVQAYHGLGTGYGVGEYIARIEVAKVSLLGAEKVKQYGTSYKPIGLLQVYGDDDQLFFGMFTGSYRKNISGGVLRKNVSSFADEINSADGTFDSSVQGIVHNMNKLRLYGYDYNDGTYISRDGCTYQQTGIVLTGGSTSGGQPANQGNCSTWGNPMSEVYLESLRYLAGKAQTADFVYGAGSKDATLGLTVQSWSDPLAASNYCAQLNVLNFNASVSSFDGNQLAGIGDLGCPDTAEELTNDLGVLEGISTNSWFVGGNGVTNNELCSSKTSGSGFGAFRGICPEAPTQEGTYRMTGIAHYANTSRIRSDLTIPTARANSRDLMVSTYGIALATNVPKIEIHTDAGNVTILPAYRLDVSSNGTGPFGGGTLVDFKIIANTGTYGKFYVNWEDSEMGGDYDQDMWGIIEYTVSGNTLTITTDAVSASTSNGQGFGYVISGTDKDGAHFHSGIYGFDYTDPYTSIPGCNNCVVSGAPTQANYTITGNAAGVLKDPLLYAAKWGGFTDLNGNNIPDSTPQNEWDTTNNSDGTPGSDGLPDNYFYATNPLQLENSLNRVFLDILERASSGTAAAVVSNNVSGVGALYQAYYEPSRQDAANKQVSWIGTVQALWLDDYGFLREDNGNAVLDGYFTDKVIQQFYDETDNKTKIRRYTSTKDDEYAPFYMKGKVVSYNSGTGAVEFTVEEISGAIGSGPFSSWTVYNLTTGNTATSATPESLVAVAAPYNTKTFTISPASTGFAVNDRIMVAHFQSTVASFEEIGTLWNARSQLSNLADTNIVTQRTYTTATNAATGGRYIKTWIDDGDGIVDSGEVIDFEAASIDATNFGFLNVATLAEAQDVVNYIRGQEIAGYRNRTIDYAGTGDKVMRLADVVNATPTIVGAPQEALNLLYKDASYGTFRKQYAQRRQVLYVGSNGGMLHAFNGGFYNSASRSFLTSGKDYAGTSVTEHPLGAELWAYVPMNLLPHLKWLRDPKYSHVYYVDGKPKVFDAKIFANDLDHPEGWGTVLVVGMRFGGGKMTVDTAGDGLIGDPTPGDNREFRSSYIVMDITNPEKPPKLLAEIPMPDGSFTTSYPAALAIKDKDSTLDANKWFLTFGSGPTGLNGVSNQNAKLYVFDLGQITTPSITQQPPPGCSMENIGTGAMEIIVCNTNVANSFVGDPMTVDWELNYKANSIYFGLVGDTDSDSGRVMWIDTNEDPDTDSWSALDTAIDVSQPVVSSVTPGVDETGQRWIYFGTGRFYVKADQLNTTNQAIYGVKITGSEVDVTDLLNVTGAKVRTNGDLSGMTGMTSFEDLVDEIANNKEGWYLTLPPIQGTAGSAPATRVINSSALAGGVLFTTAYQPGIDQCTGEGYSRLYGLYYKTGTAYPSPRILGTYLDGTIEYSSSFIELGHGFATTPSLHSGTGTGDKEVSVFTQLSTGAIIRTEASTVESVRSGMTSWTEP